MGALDSAAIRRTAGVPQSDPGPLLNRVVVKIRSRVEYPFRVLMRRFGYTKVALPGLAKNTRRIVGLFALINLYMARR